jgi:peptidoglycan/xylan/chitin deacetylase (PgdA/CDA1 family)
VRSLRRRLADLAEVPRDLLLGRYPPFVTGGDLPRGHVPVFVFHSVEPASFARKLDHLVRNGYRTLSLDAYVDAISQAAPPPDKAVLLTFDDGRGSLWSVAHPLLEERGLRGVAFLVPGRTRSRPGPLPPTWREARAGRVEARDVLGREQGAQGALLSWEEIEAMARSGLWDFASHTLTHARIHVAPRVVDFLAPEARRGYRAMDVPLLLTDDGGDLLAEAAEPGTPLLASAPRTSEALRFREDPRFRRLFLARVAEAGGGAFFLRPDWRQDLRRLARGLPVPGRHETASEREAAVGRELGEARRLLEERLGRPVRDLCYPWHASGPTARRLAAETGHRSAFAGKVPGVPLTLPGGDLGQIARIGEDYVELLPGHGRARLGDVLGAKWRRRARGGA